MARVVWYCVIGCMVVFGIGLCRRCESIDGVQFIVIREAKR